MIPLAYARYIAAQEIEETLKYAGLDGKHVNERIREKVVESASKTYYKLAFNHGVVKVFGPRNIYINDFKCKSTSEAKSMLCRYIR